jgi:hypothetical protein
VLGVDEETWTVQRMRPLVTRWAEFVLADRYLVDTPWREEILDRGTVLGPPASEANIRAAEERLGVTLPPSYRSFLLISNGAFASPSLGAESPGDHHGLLPVEHVTRLRDVHPRWVELWLGQDPHGVQYVDGQPVRVEWSFEPRPRAGESVEVDDFDRATDGLLISAVTETYFHALVPPADGGEWEMWDTYKEGATAHHCFADALDYQLRMPRRNPLPDPQKIEDYATGAARGDHRDLILLTELDAARGAEIAVGLLDDATLPLTPRWQAAGVLGAVTAAGIGSYVEHLRQHLDDADPKLRQKVLESLVQTGQPDVVEQLRAIANSNATEGITGPWATWILGRYGYLPVARRGPYGDTVG